MLILVAGIESTKRPRPLQARHIPVQDCWVNHFEHQKREEQSPLSHVIISQPTTVDKNLIKREIKIPSLF